MALIPVAPTLSLVTATSFLITVNADGNPVPPATYYTFKLTFGATTKYLNALGQLVDTKVYLPLLSLTPIGLTPNTLYSVELTASDDVSGLNESGLGPVATATTLAAAPISSIFTNIFSTTVMAHWGANSNPTGTQYSLDISEDSSFIFGVTTFPGITDTGYILTNLTPGTVYYARVKATNSAAVDTAYTSLGNVLTKLGPDTVKAIRVFNLLSERGYMISWAPNQEVNIVSYKVYRSESPTDAINFKLIGSATSPVTSFFDLVPFTFGIVWYYIVTAIDDGGNESSLVLTTPAQENTYHSFEEQPFINTITSSDFITDETPIGVVDDINTLFVTKFPYRRGSVEVFLNGVKMVPIADFVEGPQSQQITFIDAPANGGTLRLNYKKFGT